METSNSNNKNHHHHHNNMTYDSDDDVFVDTTEHIRTVHDLEFLLENRVNRDTDNHSNDNTPSFVSMNVPDVIWLGCHRFQTTNDQDTNNTMSRTGLIDDFGASTRVRLECIDYRDMMNAIGGNHDDNPSRKTRQRQRNKPLVLNYQPFMPQYDHDNNNNNNNTMMRIKWITINNKKNNHDSYLPRLNTSNEIIRFLRHILLEEEEEDLSSPWHSISGCRHGRSNLECVILQGNIFSDSVRKQIHNQNQRFGSVRVSDICPSWCLFAATTTTTTSNSNASSTNPNATFIILRKLLPRKYMSSFHPISREPVPSVGCLWETYIVTDKNHLPNETSDTDTASSANEDININNTSTAAISTTQPPSTLQYRIVAPPYYDWRIEFPFLQVFLTQEIQRILQQDADSIPEWTAWPETVHYGNDDDDDDDEEEKTSNQKSSIPWHVFPLAHCFPSNQVERFRWVEATCQFVPNTVQLLKEHLLLPRNTSINNTSNYHEEDDDASCEWMLRTALFSRLDGQRVLSAHTGWSDLANHVVRVHIPIRIPDRHSCGLWVDGCVEYHTPDNILIFDDSKIHRAFNYSNESRIVLILDLVRPEHWPVGTAVGGHSQELDDFIAAYSTPK